MTKVCPIVIVEWSIPKNSIGKTQADQSKQVMEQVFLDMTNVPSVVKIEQSILDGGIQYKCIAQTYYTNVYQPFPLVGPVNKIPKTFIKHPKKI